MIILSLLQRALNSLGIRPTFGYERLAPYATGTAATDFLNLKTFFDNLPNNAKVKFPYGQVYSIYSGAIRYKPWQLIDWNGSTTQRAAEITATTATQVGNGSTQVTLSAIPAGLQIGMSFNVKGVGVSSGDSLISFASVNSDTPVRIANINVGTKVVTFDAPISLTLDNTSGANTGELMAVGATFAVKNALHDASSLVAGSPVWISNLNIDGNAANNPTNNHWTSTIEVLSYSSNGRFDTVYVHDAPGESFMQHGDGVQINEFTSINSRGNAIHLNGWNTNTLMTSIYVDGANLDYGVGHPNGGVIASANTYRAIIDGFFIRNCRLFGIGSWDSSDNSFAKVQNGYIRDCWGGGVQFASSGSLGASTGLDMNNVEVWNCGPSIFGNTISSSSIVEKGRNFDVHHCTFYNSMVFIGGLSDCKFDITVDHDDSGTLTAMSVLSGRTNATGTADNFGGRINGTSFNASATLALSPDTTALVTSGALENCDIVVRTRDGTQVTPTCLVSGSPQSYSFACQTATGQGGPTLNSRFDISTIGGNSGPHFEGVFRGCKVKASVDGAWGGQPSSAGEGFQFYSRTYAASVEFPATSFNGVIGATLGGTPNPNGKGYGSGGASIRTEYAMVFSATNQTIAPQGWFVVEDGAVVDWRITRPGSYSTGTPAISLANASGLTGVTLTAVMGETPALNVSDSNEVSIFVHTAKNPSGAYMAKIRQDTTNSAGCGRLVVDAWLKADDAGGGVGFSDTSHESTNLILRDVRVEGPTSGWTPIQLNTLSGGNIGTSKVGKLVGPVAYAMPVGWGSEYAQRGAVTAGFASSGYIGEILTATLPSGSSVSLTTATAADVLTLALTKGNWMIQSTMDYTLTGATASSFKSGTSLTANTLPTQAGGSGLGTDGLASIPLVTTTVTDTFTQGSATTVSIAADTTIHLVAQATFSAGTVKGYGSIIAERIA